MSILVVLFAAAICYEDFGVLGDGRHDDRDAIVAAHAMFAPSQPSTRKEK